jgi:hypothetical protein
LFDLFVLLFKKTYLTIGKFKNVPLFCVILLLFRKVRVYIEEVRDRLADPLATWKIQGANSCQMIKIASGNINSKAYDLIYLQ